MEEDGKGVEDAFTLALSGRDALRLGDDRDDTWHCPWGQHERQLVHNPHGDRKKEPTSSWSLLLLTEAKRKRKRERHERRVRNAGRLRVPTWHADSLAQAPSRLHHRELRDLGDNNSICLIYDGDQFYLQLYLIKAEKT